MKYFYVFFLFLIFSSCDKKEVKVEVPEITEIQNDSITEPRVDIIEKPALIFTVQIVALRNPNKSFENLVDVQMYQEDNFYKYRFGAFETYDTARNYREELMNTYVGAFVQAVYKGNPIHIKEALQY